MCGDRATAPFEYICKCKYRPKLCTISYTMGDAHDVADGNAGQPETVVATIIRRLRTILQL